MFNILNQSRSLLTPQRLFQKVRAPWWLPACSLLAVTRPGSRCWTWWSMSPRDRFYTLASFAAIPNFQSENLFSNVWNFWVTELLWYWSDILAGLFNKRKVNHWNSGIILSDHTIHNTIWVSDEKKTCIKASLENVRFCQMLIIYTAILNVSYPKCLAIQRR